MACPALAVGACRQRLCQMTPSQVLQKMGMLLNIITIYHLVESIMLNWYNKSVLNVCPQFFSYATQYNTIQYNTIQYNTIQYNTIQYNTIQYNTIQYNTIQYNTIQYNKTLLSHTVKFIYNVCQII